MKTRIMPPTVLFICLLLSVVLHFAFPVKKLVFFPYTLIGLLLIISGFVITIWADNMFKKNNIPIKPHDTPTQIERSGPFSFSRNPMYLGMFEVLCGISLFLGSFSSIIPAFCFVLIMNNVFIPLEERNLEKEFGESYLLYKQSVRRWL